MDVPAYTIADRLLTHTVTPTTTAAYLIQALESLDDDVLKYTPVAFVLHALDQLAPGYLQDPGQARMDAIGKSRLLELITVMYERYGVHAESNLKTWLLCLCDDAWNPIRDELQVVDLVLGFVAQMHEQRVAAQAL